MIAPNILETVVEGFLCAKAGDPTTLVLGPPRIDARGIVGDFIERLSPSTIMDIENEGHEDIWHLVGSCLATLDLLPLSVRVSDLTRRDFMRSMKKVPLTTLEKVMDDPILFRLKVYPVYLA